MAVVGVDLFGQGELDPDGKPMTRNRLNRRTATRGPPTQATPTATTIRCSPNGSTTSSPPSPLPRRRSRKQRRSYVVGLGGAGHWVAAARAQAGAAIDRAAIEYGGLPLRQADRHRRPRLPPRRRRSTSICRVSWPSPLPVRSGWPARGLRGRWSLPRHSTPPDGPKP